MAGDWIKVESATPDKPEVWAIANAIGIDPDAVFGKLFRVWAWFDQHTEEGNAPTVTKMLLDRSVGVTGFCDAVISAGWMIESTDKISLPNFDRHNGKTAKNRAVTAKRVAKHKQEKRQGNDSGNESGNANTVTAALPKEEKRREEEKKTSLSGKPDHVAIITYLNDKAGKNFKPVESNLKFIRARVKEGHTLDELKAVIDRKCEEWLNTDAAQYLRPATLFNAEKFAQYYGELGTALPGKDGGQAAPWHETQSGIREKGEEYGIFEKDYEQFYQFKAAVYHAAGHIPKDQQRTGEAVQAANLVTH